MIKNLHTAIITKLSAALGETIRVEAYPRFARKVTLPAVFVEMQELAPADNRGTGELDLTARFAAHVVFDQTDSAAELNAWDLAISAAVAVFDLGRFGQPVGDAKIIHVGIEQFKPELIGYVARSIEWSHDFRAGTNVWSAAGILPTEVYLGYSPEIGIGHEPDYHLVTMVPDV